MRKTIAVHVHLNLCTFLCRPLRNNNVKLLSSMYFGQREPQWLIFGNFFRNRTPSVHVKPEQVLRPIGVLERFTQLRDSNVKHKFIFYKASSAPSPSSLGNLSKPRRQRQRERHQTKDLMSRTIAVHVRYKSLYISLPFSAKTTT